MSGPDELYEYQKAFLQMRFRELEAAYQVTSAVIHTVRHLRHHFYWVNRDLNGCVTLPNRVTVPNNVPAESDG